MNTIRFCWLFLAVLLFACAGRLMAVTPTPYTEAVDFSMILTSAGGGAGVAVTDEVGTPSAGVGAGLGESNLNTAWVRPGKQYNMAVTGTVTGTYNSLTTHYDYNVTYLMSFVAPRGYGVFLNGVQEDLGSRSFATSTGSPTMSLNDSWTLEIRPLGDSASALAGSFSGINLGEAVTWQVGLGKLRTGVSAGRLVFREKDLTNSPGSRDRLYYTAPLNNSQVNVYYDGISGTTLRQVVTPQVLVDLIDDGGGTGYTMNFYQYNPSQWTGGGGTRYVPNSSPSPVPTPWRTLHITNPSSTVLTATEAEGSGVRVSTLTLSSGSVSSGSYLWTLQEGGGSPGVTWLRTTTHASTNNGGSPSTRDDIVVVRTGGSSGTIVTKTKYHYVTQAWGEEVAQVIADPDSSALTTTYAYHTSSSEKGNYRHLQSVTDATGNWSSYLYYDDWNRRGQLNIETHPYINTPGSVAAPALGTGNSTAYDYAADFSGRYATESSRQNNISNIEAALRTSSVVSLLGSRYSQFYGTYTSLTYGDSSTYQTATSEVSAPLGANPDYYNLPYSVKRPDQTQDSYAFYFGTYSAPTFSAGSGPYFRTIVWHGSTNSAGADSFSSYAGATVTTIYLLPDRSTMDIGIQDPAGNMVRRETWVYTGGGNFAPLTSEDLVYDVAGRLTSDVFSNGATITNSYTNGVLSSTEDASGIVLSYTPDLLLRTLTAARSGGATTTYVYDGANRVLSSTVSGTGTGETIVSSTTYDLAGRVTSITPPTSYSPASLSATTRSYTYGVFGAAWSDTASAPDGGTTIKTYLVDGRLASLTGTAVVPQYYTYGVETDGRQYVQVNSGMPSSVRYQKSWTDWQGRPLQSVKPGFAPSSQSVLYVKNTYNSATGLLTKTRETDASDANLLAPTLYVYNTLGQPTSSGLDIDNNGSLTLSSNDRISAQDTIFETAGSDWWLKSTTTTYPQSGYSTAMTVTKRSRLTGFSGTLQAESKVTDPNSTLNVVDTTTDVTRGTATVVTSVTAPNMANTQSTTKVNGLTTSTSGFDGTTITAGYDGLDRPSTTTDARSKTVTTAYIYGTNQIQSVTDAAGNAVTTNHYDASGRLDWSENAAGHYTRYAYNARSQVTNQWGDGTYPVAYDYDSNYGDRTKLSTYQTAGSADSPGGWPSPSSPNTTTWVYDAATGLPYQKEDAATPTPNIVQFDYNALEQVTSRQWARYQVSSPFTHFITTYGYDGNTGELLTQHYNDTGEAMPTPWVTYSYTRSGQLYQVTDATGTRTLNYNSGAPLRLDSVSLPAFYNNSRQLNELYDTTTSNSTGSFGSYTPGTLLGAASGFQLTNSSTQELKQSYTYANSGRFVGVSSTLGTGSAQDFIYSYYVSGAVTTNLLNGYTIGANFGVTRTYDGDRNLATQIDTAWGATNLTQFDYHYNSLYQRDTAKQSGTAYADYYPTGVGLSYAAVYNVYQYNARGELTSAAMYRGNTPTSSPSSGDELPGRHYAFSYDSIGNRTLAGETGKDPTQGGLDDTYATNELNEYTAKRNNVVRVVGTAGAASTVKVAVADALSTAKVDAAWAADLVPANATSVAKGNAAVYATVLGTGGAADHFNTGSKAYLVPPAKQSFSYDLDGNLTGDGVWSYTYDAENRLMAMQNDSSAIGNGMIVSTDARRFEFAYDYQGRRVEKKTYGGWTGSAYSGSPSTDRRFLYDGANLIAEMDGLTGGIPLVRSYAWGLDLTGSLTGSAGVGALLALTNYSSGSPVATYWPAYDGNGNVAALVNSSTGALAATYEYDPYGNYLRADVADSAVADNPFRFSTKYTDVETGLVYYGLRYYNTALGRFINRDPVEETGGFNLYGFCGNNAINGFDVLGCLPPPPPPGASKAAGLAYAQQVEAWWEQAHFGLNTPSGTGDEEYLAAISEQQSDIWVANTVATAGTQGAADRAYAQDAANSAATHDITITDIPSDANPAGGLTVSNGITTENFIVASINTSYVQSVASSNDFAAGYSSASKSNQYLAIVVTLPDGRQYMPTSAVKNAAQENILGVPVGTMIPIFVPAGQNPQGMVNQWTVLSLSDNSLSFAVTWRPGGPNDYKVGPGNAIYDAYGNFEYGATGTAAGFTTAQLQEEAAALHSQTRVASNPWPVLVITPGVNNPINIGDIQSGADAIAKGGTLRAVPVTYP